MKTLVVLIATAIALGTGAAIGKECKGIQFPDQIQVDGSALSLNGLGLRQATVLKVNVYVAALYVPKTSSDPAVLLPGAPKELVMHFVRDVGGEDLKKAWIEGFEKNAKGELPALKDRIATLNGWMTDMKTGQRITFVHKEGAVEVSVGGSAKGTIKGEDFAHALFSIWLGPEPPNPEIKTGLLGGPCG